VTNVSAVVGVNGSGKSNLLELIACTYETRAQITSPQNGYFFVYANQEYDGFVIEGFDPLLLKDLAISNEQSIGAYFAKMSKSSISFSHKPRSNIITYIYDKPDLKSGNITFQNTDSFITRFNPPEHIIGLRDNIDFLKQFNSESSNKSDLLFNNSNNIRLSFSLNEQPLKNLQWLDGSLATKWKQFLADARSSIKLDDSSLISHKDNFIKMFLLLYIEACIRTQYSDSQSLFAYEEMLDKRIQEERIEFPITINKSADFDCDYLYRLAEVVLSGFDMCGRIILLYEVFNDISEKYYSDGTISWTLGEFLTSLEEEANDLSSRNNLTHLVARLDETCWRSNDGSDKDFLLGIVKRKLTCISDGERVFLSLFTSLQRSISHAVTSVATSGILPTGTSSSPLLDSIILIFDEPDDNLHPEWNRRLISELLSFLNGYTFRGTVKEFQIIISSHSPFILSDLPTGNAIRLVKDEHELCQVVSNANEKYLAANIHELFNDKFFMTSTIGEYALQTLNRVIQQLTIEPVDPKIDWDKLNSFAVQLAEPLLRNKLKDMILRKRPDSNLWIDKEIARLQSLKEGKSV